MSTTPFVDPSTTDMSSVPGAESATTAAPEQGPAAPPAQQDTYTDAIMNGGPGAGPDNRFTAPASASQPPQQPMPFWKSLLQGAIQGLAGARGATHFGGGAAGGAANVLNEQQQDKTNALNVRFANIADARQAAELTYRMAQEQSWTADQQHANDSLALQKVAMFKNMGYKVTPLDRSPDAVNTFLATNGGNVHPYTFNDSNTIYAVTPGEDNGWKGTNDLAKAVGAAPISQAQYNSMTPQARFQYQKTVYDRMGKMTPEQIQSASDTYSKDPNANQDVLGTLESQMSLAQAGVNSADTKADKQMKRNMNVRAAGAVAGANAKVITTTDPTTGLPVNQHAGDTIGQSNTGGKLYMGTTPDGRQVAGTPQELQAAGATGSSSVSPDEQAKIHTSRQLVAPNGLFAAVGKDVAALEKSGDLGTVASRWNDFMAGKVGSGPQFASLRTNMGLLGTALMQAHMGARGGSEAIEHFKQLADYRISDAATLKSALSSEFRYVTEKAAYARKPGAK